MTRDQERGAVIADAIFRAIAMVDLSNRKALIAAHKCIHRDMFSLADAERKVAQAALDLINSAFEAGA